ncbi:site-specific integrase [Ruficoccus sp. ZRK36]|uniref:tyrosine-type recombinase/integrase n=1 Tax=Ruficoccus sp. ZRK36 TaxID=2866311 RepID=UPI001C73C0CB|nr:site-specific integrase [Ruficoccus sp. ZRK36]QYY37286.1 tyrosine-type recombinase/integrase [Ruficoccus sp. ZRK36]
MKKSKYWIATFRDKNGRSLTRSTKIVHGGSVTDRGQNRKRALEIANEFEDLARGLARNEAAIRKTAFELASIASKDRVSEVSVREFFEEYIEFKANQGKKQSTMARYSGVVERLFEAIGDKALAPIESLSPQDIESFIAYRSKQGRAPKTILNDLKNLKPAFTRSMRYGSLSFDPIAAVNFENSDSMPHLPFQPKEIYAMLDTLERVDLSLGTDPQDWMVVIALGYYTGMRLGDCSNRFWHEFDLNNNVLKYVPEKTKGRGQLKEVIVPVHPDMQDILAGMNRGMKGFLTPSMRDTDKHRDRSWLSKQFIKIMEAANVNSMPIRNPVSGRLYNQRSFHSLRATCNSVMANAGVSQEIRMRVVGHASKYINSGYTHFEPKVVADAVFRIPRLKGHKS